MPNSGGGDSLGVGRSSTAPPTGRVEERALSESAYQYGVHDVVARLRSTGYPFLHQVEMGIALLIGEHPSP